MARVKGKESIFREGEATFSQTHNCLSSEKRSGPEVIKLFSCSTQLSMKFSLLINMKMPTLFGIFIFFSRENFMLSYVLQERI